MQNDYTQGTKTRRTKRYLVGILVLVLVLAISATALADNGRGAGGNGGQPKPGGLSSQPPQGTPDPASTTDGRQGQRGNGAQNAEQPGVNTEKIAEAIAALDDETAQANLTALLETYEDALEAKQTALDAKDTTNLSTLSSAVDAAKEALDTALSNAGFGIQFADVGSESEEYGSEVSVGAKAEIAKPVQVKTELAEPAQAYGKTVALAKIARPQSLTPCLVGIRQSDSASCRADLARTRRILAHDIQFAMDRQDQRAVVGDREVFRADRNALCRKLFNLGLHSNY